MAVLLAAPLRGAAQDGWSVDIGLGIAKDLRHGGGPELGAVGWDVKVFAPARLGLRF